MNGPLLETERRSQDRRQTDRRNRRRRLQKMEVAQERRRNPGRRGENRRRSIRRARDTYPERKRRFAERVAGLPVFTATSGGGFAAPASEA